ncbi:MAG TPA: protein phosphatase 2C domain-containing protein [Caulobacteraceae bacterium]|nr:protein phosphatase 2C domain-containing protein [Caulobacteraceae bacterium]
MSGPDIAYGQALGKRSRQEDRIAVVPGPDRAELLILSDGMGGAVGGDIASDLIVSTFIESWPGSGGDPRAAGSALRAAALKANKALRGAVRQDPALAGMGGTLVAVRLTPGGILFFSMGDSPLFLVRGGTAERINADHSIGGALDEAVRRGELSQADAAERRNRNVITSVLMGEPLETMRMDESVDVTPMGRGDILILASDGLETLTNAEIAAIAGSGGPSARIVDDLLAAVEAKDRPRQDNVSAIVARW